MPQVTRRMNSSFITNMELDFRKRVGVFSSKCPSAGYHLVIRIMQFGNDAHENLRGANPAFSHRRLMVSNWTTDREQKCNTVPDLEDGRQATFQSMASGHLWFFANLVSSTLRNIRGVILCACWNWIDTTLLPLSGFGNDGIWKIQWGCQNFDLRILF